MTTAPSIMSPKERTTPLSPVNGQDTAAPKPEAPTLPTDVKTLSRASLAALLAAAQRETELRDEQDRNDALAAMSKAFGITIPRLKATIEREAAAPQARLQPHANGDGSDGRRIVKPKFRNPKGPETWAGRGKPPKWYTDAIASGIPEEEMRIPEGAV